VKTRLERYFEFAALGTNWRTEILAGFTTFVTMAYIIIVNPAILHETGMPLAAIVAATCLCAAFGSIVMGWFARYPIALAPGMGLNAYFTYTVVKGLGIQWQTALGAVFLSGVAFVILTAIGVRQMIVSAIPAELYSAVAAGIGLFIALIGLHNSGIIVANRDTLVAMGNVRDPNTLLAIIGLLLIAALLAWKVRGAILVGILATTAIGVAVGTVHWQPQSYSLGEITATAFHLDIAAAFHYGLVEIVFVFLFVDLFDNVGTLVGVCEQGGFIKDGKIPRVGRVLLADSVGTIFGALTGTSTVTSYIESAAGVAAGARTGLSNVTVAALFFLAMFCSPLATAIPAYATAPALILVGVLMSQSLALVKWHDFSDALPAFITMIATPLAFSIATGLSLGLISYTVVKVAAGKFKEINTLVWILTALFILRYVYLAAA